jgi:hypothetical protein
MKNLLLFALVFSFSFSFSLKAQISFHVPFIQKSDTLTLVGINEKEVTLEIADYLSDISVKTEINFINKVEFGDETETAIYKIAIAEAIENQNKIVSKLDAFRNKNVQIGGKTPQVERQVTLYVKKGTVLKYIN